MLSKHDFPQEMASVVERPIRISIPASVAFNLDQMKNLLEGLSARLGCKPCLSGRNCYFTLERDFVVNPAGKIHSVSGGVIIDG